MQAKQIREWALIGVLVLSAFWLGSLIFGLLGKAQIAIQQTEETKAQYASLEERRATLKANLETLNTPRGQEAAIREAFSVAKSGEEVIVVVPTVAATSTPSKSWWQKFLGWF